jgi:hypothetical protein
MQTEMSFDAIPPNHWLQATRDFALLFILGHWPRVPEPKRYMAKR